MGAMNKHPSCRVTWALTTQTSLALSEAFAALMNANVRLERVLLAEMNGGQDREEATLMMVEVETIEDGLVEARKKLVDAIKVSESGGNPYEGDFRALKPGLLAETWDQYFLHGCKELVRAIGTEVKDNYLSTSYRFVTELDMLIDMVGLLRASFEEMAEHIETESLKEALENGEVSIQRSFAMFFSRFVGFMKEYLVDSLVATEVVFVAKGKNLLAS